MATIFKRNNKGKLTFGIQFRVQGNDGKMHYVCTTWKNPDNLTGVRAEKAATAYAENYERDYKTGHLHDLSVSNFNEIANIWLNTRKATMSESYYTRAIECINRMSNFFGQKRFVDMKAFEIQQFFVKMNESVYKTTKAKLKPDRQAKFNEIANYHGIKKSSREGEFTRPTLYYARKGENIEVSSAKMICDYYNLKMADYFDIIETEKHYCKESIMKYKRILSSIYNYAMSIELVNRNYASSAYLKQVIGGEPSKDISILSDAEFNKLLEHLEEYDKKSEMNIWQTIPIYILMMTGMRSCELCGLQWRDIDLGKKTIDIIRNRLYVSSQFGSITKDLKTKYSRRTLNICNLLYNKLMQFKMVYDKISKNDKNFDKDGFIFCNLDGKPKFPHLLNHVLKGFLAKAGVKDVSCHKLRHTFITRLISNNVPVNVVSKLAGHADSDITLSIYTHYCHDIDNSVDIMEKLFTKNIS